MQHTGVRTLWIAWVALLTVPSAALAQSAQCPANQVAVTRIPVGGISCDNCTLIRPADPRQSRWEFGSEPVVTAVETAISTTSAIRSGDVIVAVDGHLITTQEGGRLFRRPEGEGSVPLRVRREGRELTVQVTPQTECEAVRERAAVGVRQRGGVAAIDSVSISRGRGVAVYPSSGRAITLPVLLPRGRLGMSFSCSRCELQLLEDSVRIWSFEEPPSVESVERDGPAARAGLQNGDRLISIDGISLTTASGGRRFGEIAPGEVVSFEFERNGTRRSAEVLVGQRSVGASGGGVGFGTTTGRTFETGVVRYSGRLGDTMIEVSGEPVTVVQSEGETVIRSSTITVRLRRADGGR